MRAVMPTQNGHQKRNDEAFALHVQEEAEFARWQAEKIDLITQTLRRLTPSGTLADIGCFTGYATERYRAAGFQSAVGFDMNDTTLERTKARGVEARKWHAGVEPCPAGDGEFDATVAADIIEHIVDTDYFLSELKRITKTGGYIIITTPNLAFWISRLRLLRGKTPWSYPGASPTVSTDVHIDLNHIRLSTRRDWQALFESQGLEVLEVKGWSILHAMGNSPMIKSLRFVDRLLKSPELAFGLMFLLKSN
jgi:SAM-dependent methyltransferase